MIDTINISNHTNRQLSHWTNAIDRLSRIDDIISDESMQGLETYLGLSIRNSLLLSIKELKIKALELRNKVPLLNPAELQERINALKTNYIRTEMTVDFFADAVNTRSSEKTARLLKACDYMSRASMESILAPLGKSTPFVLSYIDKGLGASILKAGLRLWDGRTHNPVAAIKIVRHNILRPTSLIHEAGHQVAHQLGWNGELKSVLLHGLGKHSEELANVWAGWSSEIAADVFAFVHTGYASVVALHDVVQGKDDSVFRFAFTDPHPISFLRVLLGIAMCKEMYGAGHWEELEEYWLYDHTLDEVPSSIRSIVYESIEYMPLIAKLCLKTRMRAFNNNPIIQMVDPMKVSPGELDRLEDMLSSKKVNSKIWLKKEALRLLALSGFMIAIKPSRSIEYLKKQENWMTNIAL